MSLYYYAGLLIISFIIIFLAYSFAKKKKNPIVELFAQGLRNENNEQYEEALLSYKSALTEAEKTRFDGDLKRKIIEKLKIIHSTIDYRNGFHDGQK